jgi:predicted DNA-binding ribbon-helix-helix protein
MPPGLGSDLPRRLPKQLRSTRACRPGVDLHVAVLEQHPATVSGRKDAFRLDLLFWSSLKVVVLKQNL